MKPYTARCADLVNSKCIPKTWPGATGNECHYPVRASIIPSPPNCVCVEGHSRICPLPGSTEMGVQMCIPKLGVVVVGTKWGECVPLNP
jgi:hypothetical protein